MDENSNRIEALCAEVSHFRFDYFFELSVKAQKLRVDLSTALSFCACLLIEYKSLKKKTLILYFINKFFYCLS